MVLRLQRLMHQLVVVEELHLEVQEMVLRLQLIQVLVVEEHTVVVDIVVELVVQV
jgi:hypothetical protein